FREPEKDRGLPLHPALKERNRSDSQFHLGGRQRGPVSPPKYRFRRGALPPTRRIACGELRGVAAHPRVSMSATRRESHQRHYANQGGRLPLASIILAWQNHRSAAVC